MVRRQLRSVSQWRPSASMIAAAVVVSLIAWRMVRGSAFPEPVSRAGIYEVERVADDQTLVLTTGQSVRLLGVHMPVNFDDAENHGRFEREAVRTIRREVHGRRVRLELDRPRIDQQYRTLAYVYVGERLLNVEVIRKGLGVVDRQFLLQSERRRQLEDAEEQARSEGLGVWSVQ